MKLWLFLIFWKLRYCYIKAKTYDYEIIKFNLYSGSRVYNLKKIKEIQNKDIYQKELSSYIFYGNGYLKQTDFIIINKFVKRDIYIKSINQINKYYLDQNMIVFEDGLINYMLYKCARSLYQTKKIGYYYIQNQLSITKNLFNPSYLLYIVLKKILVHVFLKFKRNFQFHSFIK